MFPLLLIAITSAFSRVDSAFQFPYNYSGHHHSHSRHRHRPSVTSKRKHQPPAPASQHVGGILQLQSIEDPTVIEQLGISATIGLAAGSIVKRTGIANDIVKDEPTDDFPTSSLFLYGIADSIDDAAWVYFILTLIAAIDNKMLNNHNIVADIFAESIPTIAVTIGLARTLSSAKRILFLQKVSGKRLGRTRIFDQLIDFILAFVTAAIIISELHLDEEVGMGFKSLFAVSGVSAIFFASISKGLAENIVGGLAVQAWDAFELEDIIQLGDLTGKVVSIGLVETEIAGYDNIVTKIPNSKLFNERISNLSRVTQSQVKQILRFSYSDIKQVPSVLSDIQQEIEACCPKLVVGTALLKSYQADHIESEVNCQFDIPPTSTEYLLNREQVLLAIARATEKNNVTFAIPAINYVNNEP